MEVAALVLDYLNALKWPLFASLVVWFLRPQLAAMLSELLRRLRTVEVLGAGKATFTAEQQDATALLLDDERGVEVERFGEAAVPKDVPVTATPVSVAAEDGAESSEVLKQAYRASEADLAVANDAVVQERLYRMIYGSQIELLQLLKMTYPGEQAKEALEYYHTLFSNRGGVVPFDQYIGFLLSVGLIEPHASGFRITGRGLRFLEYLAENGIPQTKPY